MQPTLNLIAAIEFGQLVNATYATSPSDLTNAAGQALSAGGINYTVVTTIYANDLATDMNPARGDDEVSIGLICQADQTGDVAIAIRGTEGILEWIHDVDFLQVPCPFLAGAGHTEDGFTAMYESLRTGAASNSPRVVNALTTLTFPHPVGSVRICGHSLGGALATLLALDVAANTSFSDLTRLLLWQSTRWGFAVCQHLQPGGQELVSDRKPPRHRAGIASSRRLCACAQPV
jgi:Lipase (class 3)